MTKRNRLLVLGCATLYSLCVARYAWAAYLLSDGAFGSRAARITAQHAELFWRIVIIGFPPAVGAFVLGLRWAVGQDTGAPNAPLRVRVSQAIHVSAPQAAVLITLLVLGVWEIFKWQTAP